MIKRLKPKSEFSRNVLTLMTGTVIAQAIPIAITPILTRLYTPENFGLLALFISITAILGSIANGRYELAIMLPEKDEDAINIAALGLLIAGCLSFFLLIAVFVFNAQITNILSNPGIGIWLYFVPLVVLMTGLFNVLNYLNTRKKLYKDIAKANIYKSTVMTAVQLGAGFIKGGANGLILGHIMAQIVANYRLAKNIVLNYDLSHVSGQEIKSLAKRYIKFPKYSMWAGLANSSSTHITAILISSIYNLSTLGFYSLTQRALGAPASLISGAIGQVFFEQATKEKNATGIAKKSFENALKKLIYIGVPIFFALYWVVEKVFIIAFGQNWSFAGEYAQILVPLFFIQFVISPLTTMNVIFDKNEVGMYWQFILLFLHISLILVAKNWDMPFKQYLFLMVGIISIHYLLILWVISKYNRQEKNV
jgi:O-antigen/teichoic acid export membrane protein